MANSVKGIAVALSGLLLAACGEQVEIIDLGYLDEPASMPTVSQNKSKSEQREIFIPESLQGKYQQVVLEVTTPNMTSPTELELPLNGQAQQTAYGELTVKDYLPAFVVQGGVITSKGLDESNPALWVKWQRNDEKLFSGWLFRDHPTLHPIRQPGYQLRLIAAK